VDDDVWLFGPQAALHLPRVGDVEAGSGIGPDIVVPLPGGTHDSVTQQTIGTCDQNPQE
jgi:hypothetical protein